jgi:hypothetical protein
MVNTIQKITALIALVFLVTARPLVTGAPVSLDMTMWQSNLSALHIDEMMADGGLGALVDYGSAVIPFPIFGSEMDKVHWRSLLRQAIKGSRPMQWMFEALEVEEGGQFVGVRLKGRRQTIATFKDKSKYTQYTQQHCSHTWTDAALRDEVAGKSPAQARLIITQAKQRGASILAEKQRRGLLMELGASDNSNNRLLIPLSACSQGWYFGHFIDSCLAKLAAGWAFASRKDADIEIECRSYQVCCYTFFLAVLIVR